MTELKVALDLDGVLADVIVSWIAFNNQIRKPLSKQDITTWDIWKKLNINKFSFFDELSLCWKDWTSIPPTEQNLSQLTKKLSDIAKVDIVTAREKSTDQYVKNWLKLHEISFNNYISVAAGYMKADLDYDAFIDDSPLNTLQFLRNNKTILLYSQPWNQELSDPKIYRISSLFEAIQILSA